MRLPTLSIKMGPTERKKHIKNKEKFLEFIEEEKAYWNEFFQERIPQNHAVKVTLDRIRHNLISGFTSLNQYHDSLAEDMSNAENYASATETLYVNKNLIYSKSAFTKYVERQEDLILAIFMIGAYLKDGFHEAIFDRNGNFIPQLRNQIHNAFTLMSEAKTHCLLFEKGFESNIDPEKEALAEIKNEWDELLEQGGNDLETINRSFEEEKTSMQESHSQFQQQFEENQNTFNTFMDQSKSEMREFEDFYEKKLALDSAVKYWADKKKDSYIAVSILGIFILIVGGFAVYELLEISKTIGKELVDMNASAINDSKDALKFIPILHFAVISTFAIWLLRIVVKIFLSKLHGAEVANEREMFIKSYLDRKTIAIDN